MPARCREERKQSKGKRERAVNFEFHGRAVPIDQAVVFVGLWIDDIYVLATRNRAFIFCRIYIRPYKTLPTQEESAKSTPFSFLRKRGVSKIGFICTMHRMSFRLVSSCVENRIQKKIGPCAREPRQRVPMHGSVSCHCPVS